MNGGGNQTRLTSIRVSNAREVQRKFGERTGRNGEVPFRATISGGCCGCCMPFFTIPEGFYATVDSFGQQINYTYTGEDGNEIETPIWPPGFHRKKSCCFSNVRELVTKQTVIFDTPVADVMTKDNIRVHIDVCLQLRICADVDQGEDPNNINKFLDNLGVVSLMSQLIDAQAETVRAMARTQVHTSVYGLRAMDAGGKLRKIDLSKLNEDEFGPESNIKIGGGATDAVRDALNKKGPPKKIEMDRNDYNEDNRKKKIEVVDSDYQAKGKATVASVKEIESSEHFEGQNFVRASDDPNDPFMVESISERGQERMTEMMLRKLNQQFNVFGVEITDLQIQNVKLPKQIQETVQAKTTIATSKALEKMHQRDKIQRIEYENEIKLKDQEFGNEGEKIVEQGKRMVAEVNNELARERAKTKQVLRDVQERAKSKKAQIIADTNKAVAVLHANARQISSLPKFTPTMEEARLLGGEEYAGKEIVAENAAQMVTDFTKGEITKRIAMGNLEVAKINAETDRKVAELDAETNKILTLPSLRVSEELAQKCGKAEWKNEEVLAVNVAKMLSENAFAEVESMEAKAQLSVERAKASAAKAIYNAEGMSAQNLKDKRAFELAKRQIDVYQSLASNGKVSFFGSDAESTIPSVVTIGGSGSKGRNNSGGNINGGVGPWDAVRQLTESIAVRIARGSVASTKTTDVI